MSKLKKCFILMGDTPGGLEHRIIRLFKYLKPDNADSYSIIMSNLLKSQFVQKGILTENLEGVITYNQKNHGMVVFQDVISVAKILNREKFDIAVAYGYPIKASFLFNFFVKKLYISVVNSDEFLSQNRSKIHTVYYRLSFLLNRKRVDALSPLIKDYISIKKLANSEDIKVPPFTFYSLSESDFRVDFEAKENLVVWAGAFIELKQPFLLLYFIKKNKNTLQEKGVCFYFCGKGKLENEMQSFVKDNKLQELVTIKYCTDPKQILRKSTFFVSTQKYTNYPSQAILDAYVEGNIILSLDSGDSRKFLETLDDILFTNYRNFDFDLNHLLESNININIKERAKKIKKGNEMFLKWFIETYK